MSRKQLLTRLGAMITGSVVLALLFPKLLSGDFCELQVTAIRIESDGQVSIDTKGRASSGTASGFRWTCDRTVHGSGVGVGGGFPAWPREIGSTVTFPLASGEESQRGLRNSPELMKRISVEKGKTYYLRNHERLVLYRRTNPNGTVDEAYIEVNPRS